MTTMDKEKVQRLRGEGLGYKAIASKLSLSVDTVKSFCRRAGLDGVVLHTTGDVCCQCGKPLEQKIRSGAKRFCSSQCRSAWWNSHDYLHKQKDENKRTCAHCGCDFFSFQSKQRKFCTHSCYVKSRFGEVRVHDAGTV